MSDRLQRGLTERIRSPEGWSVRVHPRVGIDYRDDKGAVYVDAEPAAWPSRRIYVWVSRIPDSPDRPREIVLERVSRALRHMRLEIVEEYA